MKKKTKQLGSLLLVLVMLFSMTGYASAAEKTGVLRINGQVKDLNNKAVSNVSVTLQYGSSSASQQTCTQGLFTYVMWEGITGTLTFEKKGYTFYPASYEVTDSYRGESISVVAVPDGVDVSKLITNVGNAECTVTAGTTTSQLKQQAPKTVEVSFMDGSKGTIDSPWIIPTNIAEFNPNLNVPGTYLARAKVYYEDEGCTALESLKDSKGAIYCYLTVHVI